MIFFLHLLSIQPGFSQAYEAQPCVQQATLGAQVEKGTIDSLTPKGPSFILSATSSMLEAPKSKRPSEPESSSMADPDSHEEYLKSLDAWTCTYGAPNLVDGNIATGWAEGEKGHGKAAVVVVPLPDTSKGLQISAGYGKSESLWYKNSRPRLIEVSVFGQGWAPPVQGDMQQELPLMGRIVIALQDTMGWQGLPLPPIQDKVVKARTTQADVSQKASYLALRILDVFPGTKWSDTVISEIRARP